MKYHSLITHNRPLAFQFCPWLFALLGTIWLADRAQSEDSEPAAAGKPPPAMVVKVTRADLYKELTIPAEFHPYMEVELQAKVAGYVKEMNVDIGDRVQAGQVLATLEVPELHNELATALAARQRAEADGKETHLAYTRLLAVNQEHSHLVAQQDIDAAEAKDLEAEAARAGAAAEVEKYESLLSYTKITAPFDGVVTRRYADPGSLIQAGTSSSSQARPLVKVSDNFKLRLDFQVSVDYVKDLHVHDPVSVQVDSLNHKKIEGSISRFTHEVDEQTRTMTAEIEVTNTDLELSPGMYAKVILKVERRNGVLTIPTEAITGDRAKCTLLVVTPDNVIAERTVELGLETPGEYEVLSGLNKGDLVVVGARSQFQTGQKVTPRPVPSLSER